MFLKKDFDRILKKKKKDFEILNKYLRTNVKDNQY